MCKETAHKCTRGRQKTCREPLAACGWSTTKHSQPLPRCPPTTSIIIAAAHIYTSQIVLFPLFAALPFPFVHSLAYISLLANHVLLFVYFRFSHSHFHRQTPVVPNRVLPFCTAFSHHLTTKLYGFQIVAPSYKTALPYTPRSPRLDNQGMIFRPDHFHPFRPVRVSICTPTIV